MTYRRELPESPSAAPGAGRLGRHIEHDPRSRSYRVPRRDDQPLRSVRHTRFAPVTDQGDVGSCTGHAMISDIACAPAYLPFRREHPGLLPNRRLAEDVYSRATWLDDLEGVEGHWPPADTGSTGLAACKAAKEAGYIAGYLWAFGLADVLAALQDGPVMIGVTWWSSFDVPNPDTAEVVIAPDAYPRGGHEVTLTEIDVDRELVWFDNSWGPGWGFDGRACMSWATLARLLHEDGDAVVPLPLSADEPVPDPPLPQPEPEPQPAREPWWLQVARRLWRWLAALIRREG